MKEESSIVLTLFLEVVVALEAGTEAINGLSCFSNPESDGVYRSPQGSHFRFLTPKSNHAFLHLSATATSLLFCSILCYDWKNESKRRVSEWTGEWKESLYD